MWPEGIGLRHDEAVAMWKRSGGEKEARPCDIAGCAHATKTVCIGLPVVLCKPHWTQVQQDDPHMYKEYCNRIEKFGQEPW